MPNDKVTTRDRVVAGVSRGPQVAAHNPCPKCGNELLRHDDPKGSRICVKCRHIVTPN